jgi:hypothetical protein
MMGKHLILEQSWDGGQTWFACVFMDFLVGLVALLALELLNAKFAKNCR